MNIKNLTLLLVIVCFSLCLSANLFAQATDNGGLEGTFYNPNAAVVTNATVAGCEKRKNGFDQNGDDEQRRTLEISCSSARTYQISVEAVGFTSATQTAAVESSTSNVADIFLNVEGVDPNTVIVDTNAGEQLVGNSNSAATGSSITGQSLGKSSGREPHFLRTDCRRTVRGQRQSG